MKLEFVIITKAKDWKAKHSNANNFYPKSQSKASHKL